MRGYRGVQDVTKCTGIVKSMRHIVIYRGACGVRAVEWLLVGDDSGLS